MEHFTILRSLLEEWSKLEPENCSKNKDGMWDLYDGRVSRFVVDKAGTWWSSDVIAMAIMSRLRNVDADFQIYAGEKFGVIVNIPDRGMRRKEHGLLSVALLQAYFDVLRGKVDGK